MDVDLCLYDRSFAAINVYLYGKYQVVFIITIELQILDISVGRCDVVILGEKVK